MKNLLAITCACVIAAATIPQAQAGLTWYNADISEATLQADLGGTVTVYGFEDQTVTGGTLTFPIPSAPKYYRLDGPRKTKITSVAKSGSNLVINYQVQ